MSRVVACHQPNFLPWLGFFDKLARADVLVLLDDVQFPRSSRGTPMNRVKVMVSGEPRWVTVPVVRSGTQAIREVAVDDAQPWRRKVLGTIESNYAREPHFDEVMPVVREVVETVAPNLAAYNEHGVRRLAGLIGLDPGRLVLQSELGGEGAATDLLISLVRAAGGDTYLSGDGADEYQEVDKYAAAGLELRFQEFTAPDYGVPPGLSVVDALMRVGPERTRELLVSRD